MSRIRSLALAIVLVVSLVAVGGAGAGDTVAVDDDHGLTDDGAIEDFEDDGLASTTETYPAMSLTVAESSSDVGVDQLRYTDYDSVYLHVDYEEDIERTLRVYIPREYWHPHPDELEAIDGDETVSLEPTADGEYTAVEMHVTGETEATFRVKKQASVVFHARDSASEWLENETGIDVPTPDGASDQWEYVPTAELTADDPTFGIDTDGADRLTMQYDASGTDDPTDRAWRTVPECASSGGDDAPVCTFQGDDADRVNVLAQTDDPPDIRYQYDASLLADLRSSVGELGDIVDDVLADVRALIDGVFS